MFDRSRLATFALILTVAGYPLTAIVAELLVGAEDGRIFTVPYRALVVLVSLVLVLFVPVGPGRMRHTAFWECWWSFWFLYILRVVTDTVIVPIELRLPISDYFLYGIGATFIPAIGMAAAAKHLDEERAPQALLVAAALGSLLALIYILSTREIADIDAAAARRFGSAMLNPISLGHIGASTIILAGWWLMFGIGSRAFLERISLFVVMGIGLAALVLSSSRGPVLALAASATMLFVAQRLIFVPLVAAAAVVALLAVFQAVSDTPFLVVERLTTETFDDSARTSLLAQGWHAFLTDPVTGAGIDTLESYPHNLIVEAFVANGVVSGMLFIVLYVTSLWISYKMAEASPSRSWMPALYVQYATAVMFSGNIYGSNIFWGLMAAVVAWSAVPRGEIGRTTESARGSL